MVDQAVHLVGHEVQILDGRGFFNEFKVFSEKAQRPLSPPYSNYFFVKRSHSSFTPLKNGQFDFT